ncbi:MAG: hypothetical protein GEV06_14440 [Luteitalea sp.]|nr:hypothetical protein [Luteitalea sp.]
MSTNTIECPDKASLVTLLYGEGSEAEERQRLEGHVLGCEACAGELGGLRSVRGALAQWTAPEVPLGFRVVREVAQAQAAAPAAAAAPAPAPALRRWWVAVPLAAAAVLVLAAAAALANLDVRVGPEGLTVRTGWSESDQETSRTARADDASATTAPWRTDLARFRQELRREFAAMPVSATSTASSDEASAELFRRLQVLIDRSEARQQEQLAQQIADLATQFQLQRREDLVRITQDIGRLELQRGVDQRVLNQFVRFVSAQQSVP